MDVQSEMRVETIDLDNISLKKVDKRNIMDVVKALRNNLISPALYNPNMSQVTIIKIGE